MQQSLVLSIGRALDPADGDEQTQAYMVEWLTWINDLVESGTWVSGGQLDSTGREVSKDTITDTMMEGIGIGSYLIINAESLDDAARIMHGSNRGPASMGMTERGAGTPPTRRYQALVLQRRFKEGCAGRHEVRRGAWHGSAWPVRYYPASLPATAATRLARTVPGAAFPAPPGRPAAS